MASYRYRVLREIAEEGGGAIAGYDETLVKVGEFTAKDPGSAALQAAEAEKLPGNYIAVPVRNYTEVPIVPTTGFAIGSGDEEAPPPPPAGDGEGEGATPVSELAPGLNPEHPCETEDCSHLPMLHGAKGLGICRVEGCPCGQYQPQP